MPAVVVVGAQWGDEGKGRIVDLLARKADIIARYSAGNNAGHTVVNGMGEFRLHLVPAGIFYEDKTCLIGHGVVIDPTDLLREINELRSRGVSLNRFFVSDRAHVLMPYHRAIDTLDEQMRGKAAIGTTGKGVGPAFTDKVARLGIRVCDLTYKETLKRRLEIILPYKNALLQHLYGAEPFSIEQIYSEYTEFGASLAPFVTDTSALVQEALRRRETVLLEGAQGSLLDLDAGTYEYVTSSVPSSTAAGAASGIGIGPTQIHDVVGIFKCYMTRVGNGPMPTELTDETGASLREWGSEYGATTGRPRRCGWFDAVASRYSAHLNGITSAVLTRLDVLDRFKVIRICNGYRLNGKAIERFPSNTDILNQCQPVYEDLEGWQKNTSGIRRFADLPSAAQAYVNRIQELLGYAIDIVSVGPERDQAIVIKPPF